MDWKLEVVVVPVSGVWVPGRGGDWNSFIFFGDPDGNSWAVQEAPTRD
ncbi:hypothetical protein [Pseudonocardia sp. H11422]|nr:hypothetical protein [Pseudonocardia sp. H11422]